jgi:hypothetical protein
MVMVRQCRRSASLSISDRRKTMTSLRKQLIARVAKLGVEERALPGRDDGFASLCYRGKAADLDHITRLIKLAVANMAA